MPIPAYMKTLGAFPRRAGQDDDIDDVLTFSPAQRETQLLNQIKQDKERAVERFVLSIESIKVQIKSETDESIVDSLNQKMKNEQARLREILHNEILDAQKEKGKI